MGPLPLHKSAVSPWLSAVFVVLTGLAGAPPSAFGQTVTATHAGRPFTRVARANVTETGIGFIQGFARAQVVGDEVAVAVLGPGFVGSGWVLGRGGPLTVAAAAGSSVAGGPVLQRFHDAMATRGVAGAAPAFVFPAGPTDADGLARWSAAGLSSVMASGTVLPGSGGKAMSRIGEPFEAGGALAFIAWHDSGSGVDFRGVYRLVAGTPQTVADTVTSLPGAVGVPDSFSSQVGFDGATLAFWASRGPFAETQGLFKQSAAGGPVVALVSTGDAIPGGGTVRGITSPPTVERGEVWFCVQDEARRNFIVRERDGVLTVMVRDGDVPTGAAAVEALGQLGMEAQDGGLYFAANSAGGAGVYFVDDAGLSVIVPPGALVAGVRPTSIVLQDVDGDSDTIVLATSGPGAQPAAIVANLARPALPVILEAPANASVAGGARVELLVKALGDAPLTYQWQVPVGTVPASESATLVLPAVGARNSGYYSVRVTNHWGSVFSGSFFLNVEVAPEFQTRLSEKVAEVGDTLSLPTIVYGGSPIAYFWSRDGVPVESSSPAAGYFVKPAATTADSGLYSVLASNAWGTVRADIARLVVNPAPPNPVYEGGRFEVVVSGGATLPGTNVVLGLDAPISTPVRWVGDDLVFTAFGPSFEPLGLYRSSAAGLVAQLAPGTGVPGGNGVFDAARVIPALRDDPLAFIGSVAGSPVGIFIYQGDQLVTLIDTSSLVPPANLEPFKPFYTHVVQVGARFAFANQGNAMQGAYVASADGVRRLLDTTMDLPVLGKTGVNVQALGFDGETAAVLVADRTLAQSAMLRVAADGAVSALLKQGDPLPGTNSTVRGFGPVAVHDGVITFFAFDTAFARHVVEWRDGVLRRLAWPGMEIPGVGTINTIDSSQIFREGSRVYLDGRTRLINGTVMQAVFAVDVDGLHPVLTLPKLDGRRFSGVAIQGADDGRVLLGVRFDQGGASFVANIGQAGAEPPRLMHARDGGTGLRVTVPEGTVLEAALSLGGVWQAVPGGGEIVIPLDGAARFLRLKRP